LIQGIPDELEETAALLASEGCGLRGKELRKTHTEGRGRKKER